MPNPKKKKTVKPKKKLTGYQKFVSINWNKVAGTTWSEKIMNLAKKWNSQK
jgi:hypothetical protein